MAKRIPVEDRRTAPVIAMVPQTVRAQVERLADQARVSISEIGRRALVAYVRRADRKGHTDD